MIMRRMLFNLSIGLGVTLCSAGLALAHGPEGHEQDESKSGHSHAASSIHGGEVVMSRRHHVEVAFHATGLRAYLYDGKQKSLSMKGVTGQARIVARGGKPVTVPLRYVAARAAGEMDYLESDHSFKGVAPGSMKVSVELKGLPDPAERDGTFRATFSGLSKAPAAHHPAHGAHPGAPASPGGHPHDAPGGAGSHHDH